MKKSIVTMTATMITSLAMTAAVIAAPMQSPQGSITKECTLISVAFSEGVLVLNLADTKGNLYQYKETENFYFDSPVSCTVTLKGDTVTAVDFK